MCRCSDKVFIIHQVTSSLHCIGKKRLREVRPLGWVLRFPFQCTGAFCPMRYLSHGRLPYSGVSEMLRVSVSSKMVGEGVRERKEH